MQEVRWEEGVVSTGPGQSGAPGCPTRRRVCFHREEFCPNPAQPAFCLPIIGLFREPRVTHIRAAEGGSPVPCSPCRGPPVRRPREEAGREALGLTQGLLWAEGGSGGHRATCRAEDLPQPLLLRRRRHRH